MVKPHIQYHSKLFPQFLNSLFIFLMVTSAGVARTDSMDNGPGASMLPRNIGGFLGTSNIWRRLRPVVTIEQV